MNFDKGDAFNIPSINQWLKCSIHSIYRNIANHLVITPSDDIFVISIKKTYYYNMNENTFKSWEDTKINLTDKLLRGIFSMGFEGSLLNALPRRQQPLLMLRAALQHTEGESCPEK